VDQLLKDIIRKLTEEVEVKREHGGCTVSSV